ncbi:pantoate--beta-alanine ligase [bacterium]|nr:pantoate--beta-alanine ligase [bacterium]
MSKTKRAISFSGFESWRAHIKDSLIENTDVMFVPTMGALHEGHGDLIRAARKMADANGQAHVVVSIFINPTQFDDPSDFQSYPATPDQDMQLVQRAGADAVVFPTVLEMYPQGVPDAADPVGFGALTDSLEGAKRKGHFDGVVAVVRNLMEQVGPRWAFFGEKDWQQLAVIKKLVAHEFEGVTIVPVPTRRELDGLAMSSRNRRLSGSHRARANALYQVLVKVAESTDPIAACPIAAAELESLGFTVEYLSVVNGDSLEPTWVPGKMRVFVAARLGGVRLIDNVACLM